jgi:diguanylate cyclase (GGDEF)-like protein
MIFEQGSRGDTMYIVESGEVEISFNPGRDRKRLGPGEMFGELALITGGHARTASAVAIEPTRVREIDQNAFDALLATAPAESVALMRASCAYLLESEQELIESLRRRNRELKQTLDYLRRTKEDLDITELLTRTDELTGLYNRRCLNHRVGPLLEEARLKGSELALILVDIDAFKQVNDRHGHHGGDLVLADLGAVLRTQVRATDLPCRIGGDEFAVLLADIDREAARGLASRILDAVRAHRFELVGTTVRITCSIGGAMFRPEETWESLYCRTDQLLYQAKQTGRDRVFWEPGPAQPGGEAPG